MIKAHSPRARAYVERAKRHGVAWEWIEPEEIFARDDFICMEYPGKACACGKSARADVAPGHADYASLGHFPAMTNGGPHLRGHVFCQRWECNARQAGEVDQPTRAKWRRQARLAGPQSAKAKAAKRKFPSRGFQGSRGFNGAVRRARSRLGNGDGG